ncbi:HAMP domain-containing histidine kinase [Paenibacillus sepulcri]|uniref:histidine kinase n=2 Tax=Paenibacillus sepulcri TaxID=359917 RepID=A0ABS7C3M3_9BACL|nr:HAMP domain-containing histidine kinase [Paenibacillus sepulcri]
MLFSAAYLRDTVFFKANLMDFYILIRDYIGFPNILIVLFFPLFLISLFYFFKRDKRIYRAQYLEQIMANVQHIASGDFTHKVPVKEGGDLSQLAFNINRFVEQLQLSLEEERRSQQTKNELITNVSHDLRTPLTSITGYLGLIEQDLYRDEVELRYYISLAYEESERMSQIIHDLFEFTRLRNHEFKLQAAKINLIEMLHQLAEQFQLQLEQAQITARLHFEEPALYVFADGNRLRRVFENLITNAILYGKDGRVLDIFGSRNNGHILIDVVNYGEEIPQSDLPHIFDRFYRVEKSRSTHTGGSGLGLAIAKQIVEMHEGSIHVSSDIERTVFSVRLKEL